MSVCVHVLCIILRLRKSEINLINVCVPRILRVGGTLVLLLSPQLSCVLKRLLTQKETKPTSNQGAKPQTGIQDCRSPSLGSIQKQTFQTHQEVKSSPIQETDSHPGEKQSTPPPLFSLKHQATLRVSLGAIDGLIHKYIKTL